MAWRSLRFGVLLSGVLVACMPSISHAQATPESDVSPARELDPPALPSAELQARLGGAYPRPVIRVDERPVDARYVDALAGSWAGAALGSVGGLMLGAGLGSFFCLAGDGLACVFGILGGAGSWPPRATCSVPSPA
ncbi:MAG: hypothetical protein AB8I08_21725 [Sandaracinaceae bacterium]